MAARPRVTAPCDCGHTVSEWVPESPESLAGSWVRVRCARCGTIVRATGDPPTPASGGAD